jgi:hypothetical protein
MREKAKAAEVAMHKQAKEHVLIILKAPFRGNEHPCQI